VRVVALGTAAYGVAITLSPEILARPSGLLVGGNVRPPIAALTRSVGVRDVTSAAALALATPGPAMTALTAARVAADITDAISLSRVAPQQQRAKVLAVTCGWAALQIGVAAWFNRTDNRSS
jgi:hypothetical protein